MLSRSLLAVLLALPAAAQTAGLVSRFERTVLYEGIAISPDGSRLAWTQSTGGEGAARLYLAAASGRPAPAPPQAVKLADDAGSRNDSDAAWAPDSSTVAFFSAAAGEKDQPQLWTVTADGARARQRTHLEGYAARPHWSHDGRRIAFLYVEGGGGGGPLMAAPAQTGVIGAEIRNQRIAVLDLATGKVRAASPANLHVYDFDWSPDDQRFVATAAPGPGDNNWWIAELELIDAARGSARSIYKPTLQVAVPRFSPDGSTIAFLEGLMSDEGFHGGDVFTMPAAGGAPVNRMGGRQSSPSALFWTANDRLLVTEAAGGGSGVAELSLDGGGSSSWRTLWRGDEDLHAGGNFPNFALASGAGGDSAASAVVRGSYRTPPEVWAGAVGRWRRVTSNNNHGSGQKPEWGEARSLEWTNEGFSIQGWLLEPGRVEAGRRYPLVVVIHGGPSGSEKPAWPWWWPLPVALSSRGYYVLMPNPRGSYGQGEAFTQANVKDFGYGDLGDVLAGVDAAIARYPIDPQRLGITGWSYGGYMTMWAVTQTSRFRAAVAGAGIANWQSYYGQNLIDRWMIPFFGASLYDDPEVYRRSSPIEFIKKVKTPTLILVGERDAECPAPQSYEFWHALRTLGVPTELVVYAGEGHMFVKPNNRVDVLDRALAWFAKYLE